MARLGPEDWIHAALRRLGRDGVEQVRVEVLAKDLGVSKGSFYWHFADRPALLQATLDTWAQEATQAIIDEVEASDPAPAARLWALMRRVFGTPTGVDLLETALRAWATRDEAAQAAVRRVDQRRTKYVQGILQELGHPAPEARRRATLLYRVLMGEFIVRSYGTRAMSNAHLEALHATLVAR